MNMFLSSHCKWQNILNKVIQISQIRTILLRDSLRARALVLATACSVRSALSPLEVRSFWT